MTQAQHTWQPIEEQIEQLKAAGWIPITKACWKAPAGCGCAGYFLGPHGAWKAMKRTTDPFPDPPMAVAEGRE